jgi:hypothetical protein
MDDEVKKMLQQANAAALDNEKPPLRASERAGEPDPSPEEWWASVLAEAQSAGDRE